MSQIIKPTSEQAFERDIERSDRPVLVDFHAEWCGPCQSMKPVLEDIAEAYAGRLDVRQVDVDDNAALASRFDVRSIPTMILFNDGKPVKTIVGGQSRAELEAFIDTGL